ncbi:MAG TPA: LacI family DNA-binding transcriptional regulator [Phycisphaerae bacterium]|jgi:DNA-binding LacI/PurR family transcriptional regulator
MKTSIEDVARRAQVSISTVSRVINRRELVNERTRRRVESAIAELGYRPNMFARGLMLQKSDMLGLVLPDIHGEFYSEIIRGAHARARETGYHLVVSSSDGADDTQRLLADLTRRAIIDGLAIFLTERTPALLEAIDQARIPCAILDANLEQQRYDAVTIDHRAGALALMRHLVDDCGARRIVFIGGPAGNADTIARREAYEDVIRTELTWRPDDVYHLDYQYETAYPFALERAQSWAGPGHAVFAANDEMASGVVDAAAALGLRVPHDLAVVGFDDIRIARMTRPPLTTVRVPMFGMGAAAIELLSQRVAEPQRPPVRILLTPELIVRRSSGAPLDAETLSR